MSGNKSNLVGWFMEHPAVHKGAFMVGILKSMHACTVCWTALKMDIIMPEAGLKVLFSKAICWTVFIPKYAKASLKTQPSSLCNTSTLVATKYQTTRHTHPYYLCHLTSTCFIIFDSSQKHKMFINLTLVVDTDTHTCTHKQDTGK